MSNYSTLHVLAVSGILISAFFFLIYVKNNIKLSMSIDDYMLSNNTVKGKEFSNTLFASGIALGNLIFAIEFHRIYGLLILIPLSYFVMKFIILFFLRDTVISNGQYRTLAQIWFSVFPSKTIAKCLAIMSAITGFMSLFAELCFSSIILAMFLPDVITYKAAAFLFIGIIVIAYVYFGGYKAIVKTDSLQLWLMIFAITAIGLFATTIPIVNNSNINDILCNDLFIVTEHGTPLILFVLWNLFTNIGSCCTSPSTWQRINAVVSLQDAFICTYKNFWKALIITTVPIVSFIILSAKGYEFNSLESFLKVLELNSGTWGYILYPIVVTGFAAALFSSADTNVIASMYSLCDDNTFLPTLQKLSAGNKSASIKNYLLLACLVIVVLMSILYYVQNASIGSWIMPILYAVWNQLSILAPLAIYALYHLAKKKPVMHTSKLSTFLLTSVIFFSWGIILYSSFVAAQTGDYSVTHMAFLTGLAVVSLGVSIVVKLDRATKT